MISLGFLGEARIVIQNKRIGGPRAAAAVRKKSRIRRFNSEILLLGGVITAEHRIFEFNRRA